MKRWMIVLVAVAALAGPSVAQAAQSRSALKAEVKQLRADNRCLESKFLWYAGGYHAYYRAWDTAAAAISDVIYRGKPNSVLFDGMAAAAKRLNTDLNGIGIAPRCHTS